MQHVCLSFLSAIGSLIAGFLLHTICSRVYEKLESYFVNKGFSKEQVTNSILGVLILIALTIIFDILLFDTRS